MTTVGRILLWEIIPKETADSVSALDIATEKTSQLDIGYIYRTENIEASLSAFATGAIFLSHAYFTPLYYAIAHFSKFIRPGAQRIGLSGQDNSFMATAFRNADGSYAVVVFNLSEDDSTYAVKLDGKSTPITIQGQALQTVIIR